jgi:hypothetical protein
MTLHWPQIVLLALQFVGLGVGLSLHGKPQKPYNFYTTVFAAGVTNTILYFGGFYG